MGETILMYSILDNLNGKYSFPFFQENDKCAIREYKRAITKEMSSDYSLVRWNSVVWNNGLFHNDNFSEVSTVIDVDYD